MITIDASFWASVGVSNSDGNANGNQKDFYDSIVVNGVTCYNQKDFFENSTVNSVVYYNQFDWYKAIGVFHSEPIYDQYSFYQNVTFDGVNKVGNQKDFFEFILGIRYFTTLDGLADYYTIPTVTLTGDFEIEFKVVLNNASDFAIFLGNTTNSSYRFRLTTLGNVSIASNTGTVTFTSPLTLDGKLRTIKVSLVGNDFKLYQDNVLLDTVTDGTTAGGQIVWTSIGVQNGLNHFNGLISEVKIYDNSVTTDLIRYYKIDENLALGTTIVDSGSDGSNGTAISISSSELFTLEGNDWLGSELLLNNNFTLGDSGDWNKLSAVISVGSVNFPLANNAIYQSVLDYSKNYKIVHNVTKAPDLDFTTNRGGSVLAIILSKELGNHTTIGATASSGTLDFYISMAGSATVDGTIDYSSLKRILQAP